MKGICFKEPLFHATIEGRKTQKRRIIKNTTGTLKPFGNFLRRAVECHYIMIDDNSEKFRPRYKVGEVVYLKEPYAYAPLTPDTREEYPQESDYIYRYDREYLRNIRWQNKLFMPERYARHFIKITAVRAERLRDISDEDCFKEGITQDFDEDVALNRYFIFNGEYQKSGATYLGISPYEAYAALIDTINGKGTWDSNPWVWVYDYELCNQKGDKL